MIFKGIEYIGRFDFSDEVSFAWSGCTIKADFFGTTVKAILKSSSNRDYFVIKVDEKIIHERYLVDHEGWYFLVDGLENTKHTIELVKRTEFNIGCVTFGGFDFKGGYLIERKVTPFSMKLEIIGDSITCGFGNEGNKELEYDPKYDNAYLAYGLKASRLLNAQTHLIACSGFGLIRNYGGDMEHTMPTMIDKLTPLSNRNWDDTLFIPDVVVINLGTNDFSNDYIPNRKQFVEAYLKLIQRFFKKYPDTKILCTVGPLMHNEALRIIRDYVNEVVNYFNNVYYLEYPQQSEIDGYGVSWHPSLQTHQKMANLLVKKVNEIRLND